MRGSDGITDSMDMSLSKLCVKVRVKDQEAWSAAVHGVTKPDRTQGLNNNVNSSVVTNVPLCGDC